MKIAFFILAAFCLLLACGGVLGNIQFMARGEGIPDDPATRIGYLAGMWLCPAIFFVGALGFATAAVVVKNKRRRN